ncbi:MAG: sodium-dependent transporter [Gemmataceae bacterium]
MSAGFTSRWGLMFAMLGMAVGTGNIWRFPRILAKNGGGSFLVPWLIFLLMWSIPLILAEFSLGRGMRNGPLGAITRLIGPRFAWMGAWITFTATAIMFYYAVVAGWTLRYFLASVTGELAPASVSDTYYTTFFQDFIDSPWPLVLHGVAMTLAVGVIYYGVHAIQRVSSVLLPSLVVLVAILALRAATLPGAAAGLEFMFTVDWHQLGNHTIWLEALTQNAWDTGAGWGLITTYAIYMRRTDDNTLNSFMLGFGNNAVSLLAGIAVIGTIFSIDPGARERIVGAGNEGLTFIWIPQLFERMPVGWLFMIVFFAALFMAAWSSLIALVELATRGLQDLGVRRQPALVTVGMVGFLAGVPSAISIDFLHNQDWVWGLALILSGLFFALAIIRHGVSTFRERWVNVEYNDFFIGKWWEVIIAVLIPVQAVALLMWWFWQTFPATGTSWQRLVIWLAPIHTENTGTALAQWAIVLGGFLLLNRWLARRVAETPPVPAPD